MRHRHLENHGYTLGAIDDIVSRGGLEDWNMLGLVVERDDAVREKLSRIVAARIGDESSIDHDFWPTRLSLRSTEGPPGEGDPWAPSRIGGRC